MKQLIQRNIQKLSLINKKVNKNRTKTNSFTLSFVLWGGLMLATISHGASDFEKVLKAFPNLPTKIMDVEIKKFKTQKHEPIVSYFFQKEYGDQYLRIGKAQVEDGYVLLLGLLNTSQKYEQIDIHGYFYNKNGKFIDKEPYLCNTGNFPQYTSVCNITYKNKKFIFANKEITYSGQEREYDTSTYAIDEGFKFIKRSHSAF